MNRHLLLALPFVVATMTTQSATAQSRHERRARELEESAQPKALAGGVTFATPVPMDRCFEAVLNQLKRQGHDIETADREAGRIVTVMAISGSHYQTGARILVTFIKDSATQNSLRVAVTSQKRKKLLTTEPWSDPKVDEEASTSVARQLEEALKAL